MQFSVWEVIVSLVGTGVTGFVGYVYGRIGSHEVRLAKLETLADVSLGHIQASISEITRRMTTLETRLLEICEKVAGK